MNSKQISVNMTKLLGDFFLGVFPSDKLPKNINAVPCAFIANTDSSDKPGKHWVAFFIGTNFVVEYFDSYGLSPTLPAFKNYVSCFKKCIHNKKQLQGFLSSTCGQYCMYFIMEKWKGISMEKAVEKFSKNYEENDSMITDWVNYNFNMDTDTYDVNFLINQICRAMFEQ